MSRGSLERKSMETIVRLLPYALRSILYRVVYRSRYKRLAGLRSADTDSGYSCKSCDELKCIFIHIPKCAGVSVSNALFGNLGGGHTSVREYQMIFNKAEFEEYFKFSFVRNPWDRLVSTYFFLKEGGLNEQDRDWARNNLMAYNGFDSFVKGWLNRKNIHSYAHFIPQYEFLCLPGSHVPQVDFIGYFENFGRDFAYVADKLGIHPDLQHKNCSATRSKDYKDYYTAETRDMVYKVYKEDIEIFGYSYE